MRLLSLEQPDDGNFGTYGSLTLDDTVEVIEDVMKLHHSEVYGIQKFGARKIVFSVTDTAFWKGSVQECLDETVRVFSGKVIYMNVPNNTVTDVFIKHAPMDWPEEKIKRIFSFYGDIRKISNVEIRTGEINRTNNYVGKTSGTRKIRMRINRPIPSSLSVDNERIEVYHRDQQRTCYKCGGGHLRKYCDVTDPNDFTNRFSMDQFPELGTATMVSAAVINMEEEVSPPKEPEEIPLVETKLAEPSSSHHHICM